MGRPRSDCLALDTARCLALAPPYHTTPYHTWCPTIPYASLYHTILPGTHPTIPYHTIPGAQPYHKPHHTIPYLVWCPTIPYTSPYHTIPDTLPYCPALTPPYHTIPYLVPYHTINLTIAYHTWYGALPYHTPHHTILPGTHLTKVNPPASVIRRCHPQILFRHPEKSVFVKQINSGADWHRAQNQTNTYSTVRKNLLDWLVSRTGVPLVPFLLRL